MRIKSRLFLVALLVSTQAACLCFGVLWATGWLWTRFEEVVQSHVVAEGIAQGRQIAVIAREMKLETVEPGSADWERMQHLCESAVIPHRGFLCVMRLDNGALLCHTKLSQDPGLLRLFPGHHNLLSGGVSGPINKLIGAADNREDHILSGRVEFDGEIYMFTGFAMPELNAVLAVYQSDLAIDQFIASTIQPVMQIGYIMVAFIVGATAIVTVFLINRYEAGLAEANERLEEKVDERTRSLLKTRNAVVFGLAKLAESRDRDTGEHLERMSTYVNLLATELARTNLEIDQQFISDLAVASSLHDIGKVGIPDAVLSKPGKLTPAEREAMEMHTLLGSECLAAIQKQLGDDDFLETAQQIAASHHEHWDGAGYPLGIRSNEIPLAARIVALADAYDALTSPRPYKGTVSHAETKQWIAERYATHFDPAVVEAFIAREKEFEEICLSYHGEATDTLKEFPTFAEASHPPTDDDLTDSKVAALR